MSAKESKKCYFCNKRINEDNSHKLVDNHEYRICRSCMQLGYWKTAIEIIRGNDKLRENNNEK